MLDNGNGMRWVDIVGDRNDAVTFGFAMGSTASWMVTMEAVIDAVYSAGDDPYKLDKLYRNWFNQFYNPSSEIATDAHKLSIIGNTLREGVIPDDTVALYTGVDTQKDHFWQIVIAYRENANPHLVYFHRPDTFKEVYDTYKREWFYEDGIKYQAGIRRMAIDMQGYYEIEDRFNNEKGKEERVITVNRPEEVRQFVYEFAEMEGQLEERERIYATIGVEKIAGDKSFSPVNEQVEIGQRKEKRKMQVMKINTIALKLGVVSYINRAILLAEGEEVSADYKNIFSINKDAVDNFGGESDKLHIFHQLTSEEYGYHLEKQKKYKTFKRVKKDNHGLDCFVNCEFLARLDRVETMEVPEKEENISMGDIFS